MSLLLQNILYIFAGMFTGLMSGILGIGGGIIVVPTLLFIFEMNPDIPSSLNMHMAAGSSLAVMLFTSFAAIFAHYRIEPILWWVYRRLVTGIIMGTVLGALLATLLSTTHLKFLFACFLVFVAYKMLTHSDQTAHLRFPKKWVNFLVSFLIGIKSGLLGVGGGVLIIPYLTYCGIDQRRIAPVSSLCTMTVAAIGTLTFTLLTHQMVDVAYASGYIYWPAVLWVALTSMLFAPLGAKLSYILPRQGLRYAFVFILVLTIIGLLI